MDFHLARKSGSILIPSDSETENAIRTLFAEGEEFVVTFSKKRNYNIHKGYFEYLKKIHTHLPDELAAKWPTLENFRTAMQMAAGHYDLTTIKLDDGNWYEQRIPKSIRFDKMDQVEFDKLFNAVREVVRELLEQYGWDLETFVAVTGERLY